MRTGFVLTGILFLLAAPAAAQIDKPTAFLVTAGDILALGELTASEACIQQGTCHEANPIHPGGTDPWSTASRAFIKGGMQAVSTWVILQASKSPAPRVKWAARAAAIAKVVVNGYLMRRALDYQRDGINPSND